MNEQLKRRLVKSLVPVTSRVRTDVSAIKVADGSSRWIRDEPLTPTRMEAHVNGGPARGVCPIKEGESVTLLGLLDFDSHKGATPWAEMVSVAERVAEALVAKRMQPIAFRSSGGRGIHIYVLWDTPQDAYSVRMALSAALQACGLKNGTKGVALGQVEVFPKQDEVAHGEFGNQFILPLAGHSEPLDLSLGMTLGREAVLDMAWPTSEPVPELERPVRVVVDQTGLEPIEKVRSALFAIKNDGSDGSPDYDQWRDLAFAVHEATGGSDEGREVFAEWSAQNSIFNEKFFEDRVWHYIKSERGTAITRATLYGKARDTGWGKVEASPDGFEDVPGAAMSPWTESPAPSAASEAATDLRSLDGVLDEELPPFERETSGKNAGSILPNISNVVMACRRPDIAGWRIAHDLFRDEIMLAPPNPKSNAWRPFTDADYTRLQIRLESGRCGFQPIARERVRDAVHLVAQDNSFDSALLWIKSLEWDGVERCKTFLPTYLGVEDGEYAQAVSLYTWTALAGRVMEPGCQADMVPIFIGSQGAGKTSAVKAMSPAKDFFGEISMVESDDNLSRKMRGKIIGEIGELRGLRTKEVEAVKQFITRTDEEWIPKFKEFGTKFPRRLIFIGTTNQEQFLGDKTGNRRWLPVRTGVTDVPGLRRDVLQLWAEARELWLAGGIRWQDAERLARDVHSEHEFDDPWTDRVDAWLDSPDFDGAKIRDREFITVAMVLMEALRIDIAKATRAEEMRAGEVLRELGFKKTKKRVGNRMPNVYVLVDTCGYLVDTSEG